MNKTLIQNTNITLKEFKELLFNKFKAYPMMKMNYKNKVFTITNTYYDDISITQDMLNSFCNELVSAEISSNANFLSNHASCAIGDESNMASFS